MGVRVPRDARFVRVQRVRQLRNVEPVLQRNAHQAVKKTTKP